MDQSAKLSLPFIMPAQAQKHVTHNEAIQALDVLVQPSVESRSMTVPPSSPMEGEAYLVPGGASGDWAGHGDEIAAWQAGAWQFRDPAEGWQVYARAEETLVIFDGSSWQALASLGGGLPRLGVNATADNTNRLAVSAAATLLNHAGAGHQVKINKASAGDTASLVYQTNWSGRAEMGLAGDDIWRLKVSADGSSWITALGVDAAANVVSVGASLRPASDNSLTLGASGARWSSVWSTTGTIQTSDARAKTDIAPSDLGLDFIRALEPVRFRWREGNPETHYGFIAQQVRAALGRLGIRSFAGHVRSENGGDQGLRYDSFIAPLVAAVQELAERMERLETVSTWRLPYKMER